MKLILFTCSLLISCGLFSQVTIIPPQIHYVSKRILENSDWIKVGAHVLFVQECAPNLPPEYPTGIVFFENVYHGKERFSMSVEFKDTVIVAVTYYFSAKQADLLPVIGYTDVKGRATAIKGQWTYILNESNRHTVIVGDKKKIVVVRTLDK
jgi:hypothetical protein